MSNSLYFLRHAETQIQQDKPAREWNLTKSGERSTLELAESQVISKINWIIHSSEMKARQTADIISNVINVEKYELPEIDELRRDHKGLLSKEEYRARVRLALTDWEQNVPDWESGEDALSRFMEGVRRINIMFHDKNILIVSHGLILTLYFSSLTHFWKIAYERWTQLKFLSWGLVRDDKVLIDIV